MAKPTGKLVRLRADRLDKDDCDLFCLDLGFRDVLLDLAERLEWGKTWVDSNGDTIELTDAQKTKIEEGLEALTMACEIVVQNNITVEAPTGGTTVTCPTPERPFPTAPQVRPDGTTIETVCIPVDPNNPTGEYPIVSPDEETLTPPPGYTDWQQFIDNKCRAANYMVDALIQGTQAIDEAENRTSVALNVVQLFLDFAPEGLQKTSAWLKVLKWVEKLLEFVDGLEEIWDWAQSIVQVLEERRNEFVCSIYSQPDILFAAESITLSVLDDIAILTAWNQLTDNTKSIFIEFWTAFVNDIVPRAYDYEFVLSIPESYQPPYNCAGCGGGEIDNGWLLVPLVFNGTWAPFGAAGVSNHVVTDLGAYQRLSATAAAPINEGVFELRYTAPLAPGLYVYGWYCDAQNTINVDAVGTANMVNAEPIVDLNNCTNWPVPLGQMYCVRDAWEPAFLNETGILPNVGGACPPGQFQAIEDTIYKMGLRFRAVQPGTISIDCKMFLICREDQHPG